MKKIILILFLFTIYFVQSQKKFHIQSTVIEDDTENPVPGALVKIEDVYLTTYTDEKGGFSFEKDLPEGNYVISISKKGYDTKIFLVKQRKNLKIKLKEIRINVIKKEAKRRRKLKRKQEKLAKEKLRKIEKEKRKQEKLLRRKKGDLIKSNTVLIEYDTVKITPEKEKEKKKNIEPITENQYKYSKILKVDPLLLINKKLYNFIDDWIGTPYLYGGSTKSAIDCSSFTQRLFIKSYDLYLERTAQTQFDSEYTDTFHRLDHLKEGDLLFFGKDQFNITHVGVYLQNYKFVHATSKKVDGDSGVKISDLNHPYWAKLLLSAGRRKTKNID